MYHKATALFELISRGEAMNQSVMESLRGGLIVSCQAAVGEPLHGADYMARMACAAKRGGAIGIRANGGDDIRAIKRRTGLPVVGLVKKQYPHIDVYITPTLEEVEEVVAAGAEIVAIDCTNRKRPGGLYPQQFIPAIRQRFPHVLIMADISTVEEGVAASRFGVDLVASTMSGYTAYSSNRPKPDFPLIEQLVQQVSIPVVAEGHIHLPEQAAACLRVGAWCVVVGTAITRPQEITHRFVKEMEGV